jgi:serine/threonine protein kinase
MIGRILSNRYKLIAELGSGGMAWVYLAEDLVRQQQVAVKVLYPQHSQDLGFLQRFTREAKLSMALTQAAPQKNIVRLLDYGADRDTHYLVMEYVPGEDLGQRLEAEGALPWQTALAIARQVALALEHAHCHDIVHRDIKPSNIMVSADGTVRVLDFGIARARTSPEVTLSGFVGSPNYAAPEQATGKKVDIRADIYSLGIVLYRMLSGRLPFQGDTPWEVINRHISATPPPLAQLRPGLPQAVIELAIRAMAKRPEDRFQTPAQMVAAIEAALAGQRAPAAATGAEQQEEHPDLEALYLDARRAIEAEQWQEAVDLLSRCLKFDPNYRDVSAQLSAVGQQIQLAARYRSARRALERGQWSRALEQLSAISAIDPDYKEIADLREKAERQEGLPPEAQAEGTEFTTQVEAEGLVTDPAWAEAQAVTIGEQEERDQEVRQVRQRRLLWAAIPLALLLLTAAGYLLLGEGSPLGLLAAGTRSSPTPQAEASSTVAASPSPRTGLEATGLPSPSPRPTGTAAPTDSPTAVTSTVPTRAARPTASSTSSPTATSAASPTATPSPLATALPATAAVAQPSPTGKIAFPRFDPQAGTYQVYLCSADGSSCRRVVAQASQPDFLPGGTQLVVHSWKSDQKGLFLVDLDGNLIWQITRQIEDARPSVDFQGKAYVYHSRHESDRQPRLFRTYGAETRPLVREGSQILGRAPAWTPDGQILYAGCLGNACGILLMGAQGGNPRQVVAGGSELNPEASPDGQRLAFMSNRDGNWEIYLADLDGQNLQRLTDHPANDGLPAWSPDGQWLAFVSTRGGAWAVWAVHFDRKDRASEPVRLFAIGGPLEGQVQGAAPHELHGWLEERISWGE